MNKEPKITEYNYVLSSLGNAYFSNVKFSEYWNAVTLANNAVELDTAVAALIRLKELTRSKRK